MSSVQTTVTVKPYKYHDGQIADMTVGKDISKTVETAPIQFGRVASLGSADTKVVLGGAAAIGIVSRGLEFAGNIPPVGQNISLRRDGPIACLVNGAGSAGDELNYDSVTGEVTTAAVAGNVIAFPTGRVTLELDKIDETDPINNIVVVHVLGVS